MLKTKVFAGSITNLTDARYFAAQGVEWLSFNLQEGAETFIEPRALSAIRAWVDGVQVVGEFDLTVANNIQQQIAQYELNAVQLGMVTPLETALILESTVPLIKEIVVEPTTTAQELKTLFETWQPLVQFFVLNFTKNNMTWAMLHDNKPLSVHGLTKLCDDFLIVLSIDLEPEVVFDMLNALHLYGIHVKGGVEEKVGYKSFEALDTIFESLEGINIF